MDYEEAKRIMDRVAERCKKPVTPPNGKKYDLPPGSSAIREWVPEKGYRPSSNPYAAPEELKKRAEAQRRGRHSQPYPSTPYRQTGVHPVVSFLLAVLGIGLVCASFVAEMFDGYRVIFLFGGLFALLAGIGTALGRLEQQNY